MGVVEKHTLANFGGGVNFNASEPARKMGNKATQPLETDVPATVRQAVQQHRVQTGVASQHFPAASSGRVAVQNALNVRA
jgi:hypothetical protein